MNIYVSNYLSNSISVIDYNTFEVQKEIVIDNINPHNFLIYKMILYVLGSNDGVLYKINLETENIIDSVSLGGSIKNIKIYNDEIFITNEDTNTIHILDLDLNLHLNLEVFNMPHGIFINNNKLYIACMNYIVIFDINSKEIVMNKKFDFNPWHITIDKLSNDVYVTTLDGKVVILDVNLETKLIINNFSLPVEICLSYKNNSIYCTDFQRESLIILDYNDKKLKNEIKLFGYPQGLLISNDENYIMVTDTKNDVLNIYDAKNYDLIKVIYVKKEPTTIFME